MTQFWPDSEPVTVELDDAGEPRCFHWRGQRHPVRLVANRWRVDRGWWEVRIWREYVKLVTETGLLVLLYQDLSREQWYLHRLYD